MGIADWANNRVGEDGMEAHPQNEPPEVMRRRLRYEMRRGLLELDILLKRFAAAYLDGLDAAQLRVLSEMLAWDDLKLMQRVDGSEPCPERCQSLAQLIGEGLPK